jgi:hypothetical protein
MGPVRGVRYRFRPGLGQLCATGSRNGFWALVSRFSFLVFSLSPGNMHIRALSRMLIFGPWKLGLGRGHRLQYSNHRRCQPFPSGTPIMPPIRERRCRQDVWCGGHGVICRRPWHFLADRSRQASAVVNPNPALPTGNDAKLMGSVAANYLPVNMRHIPHS